MLMSHRFFLRVLAIGALAGLLGPLTGLMAEPGREFPRCVQQCNEIRKECGVRCQEDCATMFPPGTNDYDQCVATCKNDICVAQSKDCKLACEVIKGPPTNEEP